jgi:adenosylcobalamin-dependent ribonucleoside-triphosphate reductase
VRFVQKYARRPVTFGFGDLGEFVYRRTYARQGEVWWQTVKRVVEGTMTMWRRNLDELGKTLDEAEMDKIAKDMYDRIFNFKFLPPGRGLWAMGTPITEERHNYTALNNCAFISTWAPKSSRRYSYPFCFVFEASMLGVGCGFDTDGADKIPLRKENDVLASFEHTIKDSREGWTQALRLLLDFFIYNGPYPCFFYDEIRPKGSPINGFGGVASGPEPLKWALKKIHQILVQSVLAGQEFMTSRNIVDIMNIIGKCVVSGNVRRTALIALGRPYDQEFLDLKNYEKNPERMQFGWTSNNSVVVNEAGMYVDYDSIAQRIWDNGEPGVVWLGNARKNGRMGEETKFEDDVKGVNPCGEQTLEDGELCCLVEVFPLRCFDKKRGKPDVKETIKSALLYAKIVSTGETLWPETNAIMKRNRRIGLSLSGITQYIQQLENLVENGEYALKHDLDEWYTIVRAHDKEISKKWFGRESIKLTTVKPSGTISLLAGATPGVHYPIARYYIRRVRVASDHELLPCLKEAGYYVEPDQFSPGTVVVEFLVDSGVDETESTVSPDDQMKLTALMQECWSDNSVSVTIKFDKEKTSPDDISKLLACYQYDLKSVSMLPQSKDVYPQMPYEEIDESLYRARVAQLKPVQWPQPGEGAPEAPMFCDADGCAV